MSLDAPTIGIIGGGQLGQMLALAAHPLNVRTICLDPAPDCPASQVTQTLQAPYNDSNALRQLAEQADVLTYEFENVPTQPLESIAPKISIAPALHALAVAQDRQAEKKLAQQLGIPVPDYHIVHNETELHAAFSALNAPCILKTCRFGYDGKGQYVINKAEDVPKAYQALGAEALSHALILEKRITFDREVSLIAARRLSGDIAFYPLIENTHQNGILHISRMRPLDPTLQKQAEQHLETLLTALNYVGVLTVEFFQSGETLLFNEMAPRVHNSGHLTIEGTQTSQFENHLRAILDWPLGATDLRGLSAMLNLVGTLPDLNTVLAIPGAHVHLYGKVPRPGRKLGHITLTADNEAQLEEQLNRLLTLMP